MVLVVMKVVMVVVIVVMMVVMVMNVMVTLNQQESADPGTPSVAAAIKDIKKAIQVNHPYIQVNHTYFALSTSFIVNIFQSAKTLHPTGGCSNPPPDPWLPRGAQPAQSPQVLKEQGLFA